MKKRAGFIVIPWEDGAVDYRPIDPEKRAIPNKGGGWVGAATEWRERAEDAESRDEWWEAQDGLDEMAAAGGKSAGGKKRAEQRRAKAKKVKAWLWPIFAEAYAHLIDEGAKRVGQKRLVDETKLRMRPNDPRKSEVTRTRAEKWLEERR